VLRALLAGRTRPETDTDVAETAETMAFALDAGLAPSAALASVAPYARGTFGDAIRSAVKTSASVTQAALREALAQVDGEGVERFSNAYESSVSLGVPLAPVLRGLADELRERTVIVLSEDIRRASVRVLVPLGLVVLPAFVLACLVPLFVGGLQGITG
jgi:tight adherence protein C